MMPTMQEIDSLESAANGCKAFGNIMTVEPDDYLRILTAARRGVEADAEVRRVESILNNDIRNLTEKVIPNITERAEKAEAELAALKAAQPQEYPSSADDEATRWRHGDPIGEVLMARASAQPAKQPGPANGHIVCPTPTCDTPNDCLMKGSCRRKEQPEPKNEAIPDEILEWISHMNYHLTEHDERHAGLALRAAWPAVRDYFMGPLQRFTQPERVSVPREPTPEMLDAGANCEWHGGYDRNGSHAASEYVEYKIAVKDYFGEHGAVTAAQEIYRAMLAAAQEGK